MGKKPLAAVSEPSAGKADEASPGSSSVNVGPEPNLADEALVLGYRVDVTNGKLVSREDNRVYSSRVNLPRASQAKNRLTVKKKHSAAHTIIVAQSGSGKSYFLGTYLEELLLHTRCRMTVLDPNADFRLFSRALKTDADGYFTRPRGTDPLCYDEDAKTFHDKWKDIASQVRVIGAPSSDTAACGVVGATFGWRDFPLDLFTPSESKQRFEYEVLHKFLGMVADILADAKGASQSNPQVPAFDPHNVSQYVNAAKKAAENAGNADAERAFDDFLQQLGVPSGTKLVSVSKPLAGKHIQHIKSHLVDDSVASSYANTVDQFRYKGLLEDPDASLTRHANSRATIVDIPSLQDGMVDQDVVLLALNSVWRGAKIAWATRVRDRASGDDAPPKSEFYTSGSGPQSQPQSVAHFVVIDEAHNLVPHDEERRAANPVRELILERIVKIAAEGRKYGLFLILVTQRPDKVDRRVLAECTNQAIMRTTSPVALEVCESAFGIALTPHEKSLIRDMPQGGARLSGGWTQDEPGGSAFVRAFGRRTMEGGVNLDSGWMAAPVRAAQSLTELVDVKKKRPAKESDAAGRRPPEKSNGKRTKGAKSP